MRTVSLGVAKFASIIWISKIAEIGVAALKILGHAVQRGPKRGSVGLATFCPIKISWVAMLVGLVVGIIGALIGSGVTGRHLCN